MSVVNKMLQDLEQRQQQEQADSTDYQTPQKRPWLLILLLLTVLLVAAGWYAYEQHFAKRSSPSVAPAPIATKSSAVIEQLQPTPLTGEQLPQQASAVKSAPEPVVVEQQNSRPSALIEQPKVVSQPLPEKDVQAVRAQPPKAPQIPDKPRKASTVTHIDIKPSNKSNILRNQINHALEQGDSKAAIKLLAQLTDKEPDNVAARKKLASLQYANQQITEAQQNLSSWIGIWPDRADLRLMLAKLYQQQQQPDKALAILQDYKASPAQDTDYVSMRANLAQQQGKHDDAYRDYLRLVGQHPDQARWWLGLAINAERVEQHAAARAAYQRALELDQLGRDVEQFIRQRMRRLEVQP